MAEVATINANVKPTLDVICDWHARKAERGELSDNTARLRISALRMLATPLAEDEPRDAEWMREHLESLARRWATLNPQYKANTAITYQSRAKAALDDYFAWRDDPKGFHFKERAPRATRPKAPKAEPSTAQSTQPPVAAVRDAEWEAIPPGVVSNAFRIGPGREFRFSMPEEVTMADVWRIAAHLATYAADWSPAAGPSQSAALARTDQE